MKHLHFAKFKAENGLIVSFFFSVRISGVVRKTNRQNVMGCNSKICDLPCEKRFGMRAGRREMCTQQEQWVCLVYSSPHPTVALHRFIQVQWSSPGFSEPCASINLILLINCRSLIPLINQPSAFPVLDQCAVHLCWRTSKEITNHSSWHSWGNPLINN